MCANVGNIGTNIENKKRQVYSVESQNEQKITNLNKFFFTPAFDIMPFCYTLYTYQLYELIELILLQNRILQKF